MREHDLGTSDDALILDLTETKRLPGTHGLRLLAALGAVALLGLVAARQFVSAHEEYATQPVRTGDLVVSVTATGPLEPTEQVDIGSELSGTLRSVEVDYNAAVHAGQVLARLDTTRLEAQALQAKSSLEAAQAAVDEARASQGETQSQLARLRRVQELSGGKVPSQQELAAAQTAAVRAEGAVRSAEAAVAQAKATLGSAAGGPRPRP